MRKYTFYVSGTHCESCKIYVEDTLCNQGFAYSADMDIANELLTIETEKETNREEMRGEIEELFKERGYSVTLQKNTSKKNNTGDIVKWVLLGTLTLVLFFVIQKSGLLNVTLGSKGPFVTSFLIGVIASLSSCLAVVGGLILSLSAKIAEEKSTRRPIVLFHVGRIAGFALLGGVLGFIGGVVGVNYIVSGILGIIASLVMVILGINLLGIFSSHAITLPVSVFSFFRKGINSSYAPTLLGVGTFFLPCGFTQSMQISALASGSFISGSLTMLSFVLGTFPILALISFGSLSFSKSKYSPLFFKAVGAVVIGLGLFSLFAGLAGLGIINPLFSI